MIPPVLESLFNKFQLFLVDSVKFLRKPFLQNNCGGCFILNGGNKAERGKEMNRFGKEEELSKNTLQNICFVLFYPLIA